MASKDFQDLMDLLFNKRQQVAEVETNLNNDGTGRTQITFKDGMGTFSSKEPDVVIYTLSMRKTIDSDGNRELAAFKDMEQYYRDIDFLSDADHSKIGQASRDIAEGRYIFDFDPDPLIDEFLLSSNRKSIKFSKLKSEHFQVAAYCLHASLAASEQHKKMKLKTPGFERYYQAIGKVYIKHRNDPNFVKIYIQQRKATDFDLENYMTQVKAITQHIELAKTIFPKDGIQSEQGILFMLDAYRKCAEACAKPLNLLRVVHELSNGIPSPKRNQTAEENKAILQPILGNILDCYDPRIRHAESHLSTVVDASNSQVHFYDDRGKHELLVTYSFVELANMTNELQNHFFPALAFAAYMQWRTTLLVITHNSLEYKLALLKIGN